MHHHHHHHYFRCCCCRHVSAAILMCVKVCQLQISWMIINTFDVNLNTRKVRMTANTKDPLSICCVYNNKMAFYTELFIIIICNFNWVKEHTPWYILWSTKCANNIPLILGKFISIFFPFEIEIVKIVWCFLVSLYP